MAAFSSSQIWQKRDNLEERSDKIVTINFFSFFFITTWDPDIRSVGYLFGQITIMLPLILSLLLYQGISDERHRYIVNTDLFNSPPVYFHGCFIQNANW